MSLDEAIKILKGKPGSLEALGPEFVQHARAAEVVGNAHRRRTRDQSPNLTAMGGDPEGEAGPVIVARLPGPASSYSIGTDGDGDTVVWQHSSVEGVLDPSTVRIGTATTTDRTALAQRFRAMTASRDSKTRGTLAEINRKNRERAAQGWQ